MGVQGMIVISPKACLMLIFKKVLRVGCDEGNTVAVTLFLWRKRFFGLLCTHPKTLESSVYGLIAKLSKKCCLYVVSDYWTSENIMIYFA